MLNLYFGNLFSIITTTLVVGMILFIGVSILNHQKILYWGRRILIFIIVGTGISGVSAIRDAYMTEKALFSPEGLQSTICSLAGSLIFLIGIVSIFVRNQKFRKIAYFVIAALFFIQIITIELSRIALL